MAPDALLRLQGLSKLFPGGVVGLDSIDLDIAEGEFLTLPGPSGCGGWIAHVRLREGASCSILDS